MEELQNKKSSQAVRFLWLFVIVYFFFYIFPFPLTYIPFIGKVFKFYNQIIEFLTIRTGENILGLEHIEKVKITGSGDTAFDYLKLSYGFSKFLDGQFSYPSLERLDQKIGDSSPMGLLWTFMGYSQTYAFFGGLCQVTAGFLLFFRRTSVIGSLLAFMVMTNIVVLNFSYDVPVKLFSMHLTLISLLILYPNLKNLFCLLFLNKTIKLVPEQSLIKKKEIGYVVLALKAFVIMGCVFIFSVVAIQSVFDKPAHNLQAIYYPKEFTKNETDAQWQKFIINNRYATVFYDKKNYEDFDTEIDITEQIILLKSKTDTLSTNKFKYYFSDDNRTMYLSGKFKTDSIAATFSVKRKEDFELVKRNFNWISEYPYNK